ncbi:BMP-binding endothelial regulator protein-like protein [Leptotrombidium deliense]|uniref:BMP-binding endothelial regulator protein-like protein n=1 Tax=Leptotrombidium deliense TaxID=299467 RepID=A0A443SJG7_9ACAR|nr:BMP-binding endothelial regulator protein-like protein [Leptotrombidium deliense]
MKLLFTGQVIKCSNEGEYVNVPMLFNDPCIKCKCFKEEVVCNREQCSNSSNCYLLISGKNNSCCNKCKGCWYENRYLKSGEQWIDSKDACRQFICMSGVITESRMQCFVPCRHPIAPKKNECCPLCKGCELNGVVYENGDTVYNVSEDKCVQCKCKEGNIECFKESCPVLSCPTSKIVHKPKSCCPECRGHKIEYDAKENCFIGSSVFQNGQKFNVDKCTNCSCNSGK